MDSREPQHPPPHPHHHHHHHHQQQHQQPPNIMVGVGPTPSSYPASIMAPATARFPFTSPLHHHHHHHQQQQQQQPPAPPNNNHNNHPSEPFNNSNSNTNNNAAATYDGASSALKPCGFPTTDSSSATKKKRGRPRKYSPDGNIALALAPTHASPSPPSAPAAPRADSSAGGGTTPSSEPLAKKHRGRPPGSGKKQMDALGAGGIGFTPHVILVDAGEDISAKIMAFCQQGPRTVCILSANGAVCNVSIRQPAMLGGTVTYEGRFEIISLSGSLLQSENNSGRSRSGGLSVSLAGSDGRVFGGGVAGVLTAASPVQVIVGSFIADGKKSNSSDNHKSGPSSMPSSQMLNFGAPVTPTSPTSQGPSSESSPSDDNDNSPFNKGPGLYNNASQPIHNMPMYHHQLWAGQTQQ